MAPDQLLRYIAITRDLGVDALSREKTSGNSVSAHNNSVVN